MLRPYYGEFLYSPAALHLDLGTCSNGCFYCFANLNKGQRSCDVNTVAKQIAKARNGGMDLVSQFLRGKYPICVSNTSDPFCASQYHTWETISELLDGGSPLFIQTKGGPHAIEWLRNYRGAPGCIAVTIESDSEDIIRRVASGAPSIELRLELMRLAHDAGWHVVWLWAPAVPSWWTDIGSMAKKIFSSGCSHAWEGELHFSVQQRKKFENGDWSKAILYGMKKIREDQQALFDLEDLVNASGIDTYADGCSVNGWFWEGVCDTSLLTIDDWHSHLDELYGDDKVVAYKLEDMANKLAPAIKPSRPSEVRDYVVVGGGLISEKKQNYRVDSFADVVRLRAQMAGTDMTWRTSAITRDGVVDTSMLAHCPIGAGLDSIDIMHCDAVHGV
jgi:DNA repair photolyase